MIVVFLMVGFVVVLLIIMYRIYLNMQNQEYICRKCGWRGMDTETKTEIIHKGIMICYIQKCPNCGDVLDAWDTLDFRI